MAVVKAQPKIEADNQNNDLFKAMKAKIVKPQLGEVAFHFFSLLGGERAVAQMLVDQIRDPDCTPQMKAKILDLVLTATKFANQQDGAADVAGEMDDADLERLLTEKISNAMNVLANAKK